jgi:hypothetical protein
MTNLKETLTGYNINEDMNIIVKFAVSKLDEFEEITELIDQIGENCFTREYIDEKLYHLKETIKKLNLQFSELEQEETE